MFGYGKKGVSFICHLDDNAFKVVKCACANGCRKAFSGFECRPVAQEEENGNLAKKVAAVLKEMGFNNDRVTLSLPRNLATARFIKVPSRSAQEIERIVSLQSPTYLPYQDAELVTGHQVISVDKAGFSRVNLIIAHKEAISRYLNLFRELKAARVEVFLSSYGLCNFYNHTAQKEDAAVMLLDMDAASAELAVVAEKKLLFSRYLRMNRQDSRWEDSLIQEINLTRELYYKEFSQSAPDKIFLLGETNRSKEALEVLKQRSVFPARLLPWPEKMDIPPQLLNGIVNSDNSFASLIGLGLEQGEDSLTLLPADLKAHAKKNARHKEHVKLAVLLSLLAVIWAFATTRDMQNKSAYIRLLKGELAKVTQEARPLEDMERTLQLLDKRKNKESAILNMLLGLYRIMPQNIYLSSFNYEEGRELSLRGQAEELNAVFAFISGLERYAAFRDFGLKVKYATKKRVQDKEIVDFEIAGAKK